MEDKLKTYIEKLKQEDGLESNDEKTLIESEINGIKHDTIKKEKKLNEYKNFIKGLDKKDYLTNIDKVDIKEPSKIKKFFNKILKKISL